MKYLITNADDYGYRPDISQAIIDASNNGILRSTTVLINFATDSEIKNAIDAPQLALGLHLNITSGSPISPNWKNKYGDFYRPLRSEPNQFFQQVWLDYFSTSLFTTEDVYIEYKAQIELFMTKFNRKPTHIDSHHYSSAYNKVFPAYVQIAQEYNLPVRQPVIWEIEANQHPSGNITYAYDCLRKIKELNIRTTTHFSLKFLNRYPNPLSEIQQEISTVGNNETIEIAFHPGYDEDWRFQDLQILQDASIITYLKTHSIKLTDFSAL